MTIKKNSAMFAIAATMFTGVVAQGAIPNATAATQSSTATMVVKPGVTLNVRSGPGTSYGSVGSIGHNYVVTGDNLGNGWFKITQGDYSGKYVSTAYLNSMDNISTSKIVKSGISLNVRASASTSSSIKGKLNGGDRVTGFSVNGWFKITSGPYSGYWVSDSWLTTSTTTAPAQPSTPTQPSTSTFNGYISKTLIKTLAHSSGSTSAPITRYLSPGVAIRGTIEGDWLKTTSGDYVSRALITTTPLSNGNIPSSRLCNIPTAWNSPGSWDPGYTPSTVRQIDCYALKSLTGLENAYHAKFGRYARIDLAYRPLSEQYYWYNKFGYPRAAMPGTSNHGLGVAVDFRETDVPGEEFGWGGEGYNWLKANGAQWGFRNTFAYGTTGESYHWDFEGVN